MVVQPSQSFLEDVQPSAPPELTDDLPESGEPLTTIGRLELTIHSCPSIAIFILSEISSMTNLRYHSTKGWLEMLADGILVQYIHLNSDPDKIRSLFDA
jgi:hypothetical protein